MNLPKISVCIPIYNGDAYLAECIESALAQAYPSFEVVLGDNNSSDRSFEIAAAFAARDPRIVVVHQAETVPMAESWNRCVAAARGDYIKVLPCDDRLHPDCLAIQAEVLDADAGVGLAACGKTVMNSAGRPAFSVRSLPNGLHSGADFIRNCLRGGRNCIGEPGCMLFRRSTFSQTGGFDSDLEYHLDFDLWLRMAEQSALYYDRRCLVDYRLHGRSGTRSLFKRIGGDYVKLLEKHKNVVPDLTRPSTETWLKAKVWFLTRCRALVTQAVLAFE